MMVRASAKVVLCVCWKYMNERVHIIILIREISQMISTEHNATMLSFIMSTPKKSACLEEVTPLKNNGPPNNIHLRDALSMYQNHIPDVIPCR